MIKHYVGYHNTFAAGGLTIQKGPWKPSQNDFIRPLNQEHAGHLAWKTTTHPGGTQVTIPQIKTNSVKYKDDHHVPKGKGLTPSYSVRRGGRKGRLQTFSTVEEGEVFLGGGSLEVSPTNRELVSTTGYTDRGQSEGGGKVPTWMVNNFNSSEDVAQQPNDDAVDDLLPGSVMQTNPMDPLVDHLQKQDQINSVANDSQIIQNTNAAVVIGDQATSTLGPQVLADPGSYNPLVPKEVVDQQFQQFQTAIGGDGIHPTLDTRPARPPPPDMGGAVGALIPKPGNSFLYNLIDTLADKIPDLRAPLGGEIKAVMDFLGISPSSQIPNPSRQEMLNILQQPSVVDQAPEQQTVRETLIQAIQNQTKPLSVDTTGMTPSGGFAADPGREEWFSFKPRILKPDKKLNTTVNGKTEGVAKKKTPRAQTKKVPKK